MEAAVGTFQRRIGLEADGVVGPLTLRELNRSVAGRVAQIRANLERWRWLDENLGRRHIRVNIANFSLETWENGQPIDVYDVIVGRTYRKTPVFSDAVSFVVFKPMVGNAAQYRAPLDKLPAFQADPGSVTSIGVRCARSIGKVTPIVHNKLAIFLGLKNSHSDCVNVRVQKNALGKVKLMFPNKHNVYLHDTPTQQLFKRTRRDFSSGCIRVHRSLDLTESGCCRVPLAGTEKKIDSVVKSGRETRVNSRPQGSRTHPLHDGGRITDRRNSIFFQIYTTATAVLISALDYAIWEPVGVSY